MQIIFQVKGYISSLFLKKTGKQLISWGGSWPEYLAMSTEDTVLPHNSQIRNSFKKIKTEIILLSVL